MTRRQAMREEWIVAAAWALASSAVWVARAWLPALAALGPDCPFHAITGVPCLACGTTRAALLLAQGDPLGALLMNPLATVVLTLGWAGGFVAPFWLGAGFSVPRVPNTLPGLVRIAVCALLVGDWIFLVVRHI